MSNIQALVDALKWYQEIAQSANRHIDSANKATVLHALLVELSLDAGNRATQALADYYKSQKEDWNDIANGRDDVPSGSNSDVKSLASHSSTLSRALALLEKYEQWEADMISCDAMWWPNSAKDALPEPIYEKMLELQAERNILLNRFQDVAGSQTNSIDKK